MNRVTKELKKRGLIFSTDEEMQMTSGVADASQHLVSCTGNYIVLVFFCAVLPPELRIFDRNFSLIATQLAIPDDNPPLINGYFNKWESTIYSPGEIQY